MEKGDRPVDFPRMMLNVCLFDKDPHSSALGSVALKGRVESELAADRFTSLLPRAEKFIGEIRSFFFGLADNIAYMETLGDLEAGGAASVGRGGGERDRELVGLLRARLGALGKSAKQAWVRESRRPGSAAYHDVRRIISDNTLR